MKNLERKEIESHIKKAIILGLGDHANWDEIVSRNANRIGDVLIAISPLIKKEKDKMIFETLAHSYLTQKCFFDTYYDFNDTLNNLKKTLIKLVDIMNE